MPRAAQDSLAEGMHLIDFEQLKMENAALREKIEERGDEVARLRRKTHATVQASRPARRPGSAPNHPTAIVGGCTKLGGLVLHQVSHALEACRLPVLGLLPPARAGGTALLARSRRRCLLELHHAHRASLCSCPHAKAYAGACHGGAALASRCCGMQGVGQHLHAALVGQVGAQNTEPHTFQQHCRPKACLGSA